MSIVDQILSLFNRDEPQPGQLIQPSASQPSVQSRLQSLGVKQPTSFKALPAGVYGPAAPIYQQPTQPLPQAAKLSQAKPDQQVQVVNQIKTSLQGAPASNFQNVLDQTVFKNPSFFALDYQNQEDVINTADSLLFPGPRKQSIRPKVEEARRIVFERPQISTPAAAVENEKNYLKQFPQDVAKSVVSSNQNQMIADQREKERQVQYQAVKNNPIGKTVVDFGKSIETLNDAAAGRSNNPWTDTVNSLLGIGFTAIAPVLTGATNIGFEGVTKGGENPINKAFESMDKAVQLIPQLKDNPEDDDFTRAAKIVGRTVALIGGAKALHVNATGEVSALNLNPKLNPIVEGYKFRKGFENTAKKMGIEQENRANFDSIVTNSVNEAINKLYSMKRLSPEKRALLESTIFRTVANLSSEGGWVRNPFAEEPIKKSATAKDEPITPELISWKSIKPDYSIQPRVEPFAEATVKKIQSEGFDINKFQSPAFQVWEKPNGDLVPLSGFSRYEFLRQSEGKGVPEKVPAIVHRDLTREQAKQIADMGNQLGTNHTVMDNAKVISEAMDEGRPNPILKGNMLGGYSAENYADLWRAVKNEKPLVEKLNRNAISEEDALYAVREGRNAGLDVSTTGAVIRQLVEKNNALPKAEVKSRINTISKIKEIAKADEQIQSLFGDNIDSALTKLESTALSELDSVMKNLAKEKSKRVKVADAYRTIEKSGMRLSEEQRADLNTINQLIKESTDKVSEILKGQVREIAKKSTEQQDIFTAKPAEQTVNSEPTPKPVKITEVKPKEIPIKKQIAKVTGAKGPPSSKFIDKEATKFYEKLKKTPPAEMTLLREQLKEEAKKANEEFAYEKANPLRELSDSDLAKLQPVGYFGRYANDLVPLLEKTAKYSPRFYDVVRERVIDPIDRGNKLMAEEKISKTNELDKVIQKDLGITARSRMSALVQMYGEGTVTFPDIVKEVGKEKAQRIAMAEKWFRNQYDDYIDRVNEVMKKMYPNKPERLVPKRADYFRHMDERSETIKFIEHLGIKDDVTPEMLSTHIGKPNSKILSFMKERLGGRYTNDAVTGMKQYIDQASYSIHLNPVGKEVRTFIADLSKRLENMYEDVGAIPDMRGFIKVLDGQANVITGTPSVFDRLFYGKDAIINPKIMQASDALVGYLKGGAILGNASSVLAQSLNLPFAIGDQRANFAKGLPRAFRGVFGADAEMAKSGMLKSRYAGDVDLKFDQGIFRNTKSLAGRLLSESDKIFTKMIWSGYFEKGKSEGKIDPIKYADDQTARTVGDRRIGKASIMQQSRIAKTILPFTFEVQRNAYRFAELMGSKNAATIGATLLALHLFASAYEQVTGGKSSINPVGALIDSIGMVQKNAEDGELVHGLFTALGRMSGELLSAVPGGAYTAAFMDEQTRKDFFGNVDPTRFGTGLIYSRIFKDPAYAWMPIGASQTKKIVGGIETIQKGEVQTSGGDTVGKFEPSADNYIKALMFGKWSLDVAQKYFDSLEEKTRVSKVIKKAAESGDYERAHILSDKYKSQGIISKNNQAIVDAIKKKFDIKTTDFNEVSKDTIQGFKDVLAMPEKDREALISEMGDKTKVAFKNWESAMNTPDTFLAPNGKPFTIEQLWSHLRKVRVLDGEDPKSIPAKHPKGWKIPFKMELEWDKAKLKWEKENRQAIIEKDLEDIQDEISNLEDNQ